MQFSNSCIQKLQSIQNAQKFGGTASLFAWLAIVIVLGSNTAQAHIIPPEKLHPVAEAYRRVNFLVNLNPIVWEQVEPDIAAIAEHVRTFDAEGAARLLAETQVTIARAGGNAADAALEPMPRQQAAATIFQSVTRAVSEIVRHHIEAAEDKIGDRAAALQQLRVAQGVWAAFEDGVRATDPDGHRQLGDAWLRMPTALGSPGLLGHGTIPPDRATFESEAREIISYVAANFGADFAPLQGRPLAPLPSKSPTFDAAAQLPIKLPPGSNINKQIPRPRQILGMASRGVDESETVLIALGDMAFDSAYIFGEPARSLGITCNTCHNKGVTNPNFSIPGLSARPGGLDVSNSYFEPHANNGFFGHLDTPDLRGIRFTAPYGRNGRTTSLREFVRTVIVGEFNGEEPDPMLLDGMIAYMNEFEFLSNPALNRDGTLNASASDAARRGEKIFNRNLAGMGGRSCATCHIPSSHFADGRKHDIGTVHGYEHHSLDRALDTPTLLSAKYTQPYFHDGSQPTLRAVNDWFNNTYKLGLSEAELDDLTAYVETVGDGVDAYEDSPYYLDAELEEFSFFLSTFEFLDSRNKTELMNTTFQTIAFEIRNHQWELRDQSVRPVMVRMAEIMDEAYAANVAGDRELVRAKVAEYRELYEENVDVLK
jgi:cytochrome c peroxidase